MPVITRLRSARAFTLVELLVVILILGILIAVAAPSFLGQTEKAHDSVAKQHLTVAYKAAKASTVQEPYTGDYVDADVITAINAEGSGLSATAGSCPLGVTSPDPKDIIVDSAGTGGADLVICNDPTQRIWTLAIGSHGPPSFSLCLKEGGVCNNIVPDAPAANALPSISGTAQAGQTLTATPGTWSGGPVLTYQWQRCSSATLGSCSNIAGALATTLTLTGADEAQYLRVVVTGTNAGGSSAETSAPAGPVLPLPPTNSAAPTVSGTAQVGQTLTAANGTWSGSPTFAYQWLRCTSTVLGSCVNIAGATNQTRVLAPADENEYLRVVVTGTNTGGSSAATSDPTSVVLAAFVAPVNTVLPALSGSTTLGSGSLTASTGTWTGNPTPTYTYQWQRTPGYAKAVLADSPYAYYRLDTGTGDVTDSSGNNHYGYSSGTNVASALASDTNGATQFAGTQWMEIATTTANFSTGLTLEAWIKTSDSGATASNTVTQDNVIVGDTGNATWFSWGVNNGKLSYRFYNTGASAWQEVVSAATVADGQWHHVSTYHDTNGSIVGWIDGVVAYNSGIPYDPTRVHPTSVGAGYGNGASPGGFFNGQIDEVAIWNFARNSSSHYDAETSNSGFANISGATSASRVAVEADRGERLRAVVTATNTAGATSATSLSKTVTQPVNMLTDGSFEAGGSWYSISGSAYPVTVVSSPTWHGTKALSTTADYGAAHAVSPFLPISVLKSYTISAAFMQDLGTADANAAIYLELYNSSGAYIGVRYPNETSAGLTYPSPVAAFKPTSTWTRYGATFSSGPSGSDWPAGTAQVRLNIRLISYPSTQVRIRVDGAGMYEGNFAPVPYAP